MHSSLSDDDLGKSVETPDGREIGIVTAVENETAQVEPNPGIFDSIRAALGWERKSAENVWIDSDAVIEITDDVVRLEDDLSAQGEPVGGRDDRSATRGTGDERTGTTPEPDSGDPGREGRAREEGPPEEADHSGVGESRETGEFSERDETDDR